MSTLPGRLPFIALGVICALFLIFVLAGKDLLSFIAYAATTWNLLLFVITVGVLLWFVYSIYMRRVLRARRIAAARMRRLMEEARDREPPHNSR